MVLGQLDPKGYLTHSFTPVPLADSISCQMMNYLRSCPRQRTPPRCSPTCASALRTLPGWVIGPGAQGLGLRTRSPEAPSIGEWLFSSPKSF